MVTKSRPQTPGSPVCTAPTHCCSNLAGAYLLFRRTIEAELFIFLTILHEEQLRKSWAHHSWSKKRQTEPSELSVTAKFPARIILWNRVFWRTGQSLFPTWSHNYCYDQDPWTNSPTLPPTEKTCGNGKNWNNFYELRKQFNVEVITFYTIKYTLYCTN